MKNKLITLFTILSLSACVTPKNSDPIPVDQSLSTICPSYPILINNGEKNEIFMEIEFFADKDSVLSEATFSFIGSDNPKDLINLQLVYKRGEELVKFNSREVKGNTTLVFQGETKIKKGRNLFYLLGNLHEKTNITHKIRCRLESMVINDYKMAPDRQVSPSFRRIGTTIRKKGDSQVDTYRIPALLTTESGVLLSVYDVRFDSAKDLPANINVGLSRSLNGGQTWETMRTIIDMGNEHLPELMGNGVGDACILQDPKNKTLWVAGFWSHGDNGWGTSGKGLDPKKTGQILLSKSIDDGVNWSKAINITDQVKYSEWNLFFQCPGRGIALKDGTLVFPVQYRDETDQKIPYSTIMYSKDNGQSWTVGKGAKSNCTEAQVVELNDGSLMLNMRDNRGQFRSVAVTKDLGETWTEHESSRKLLPDPICMGSLIKVEATADRPYSILLFSNPNDSKSRKKITIKASLDEGKTWPEEYQLEVDERHCYGYSSLSMIDNENVGLLYEGKGSLNFIRIPLKDIIPSR